MKDDAYLLKLAERVAKIIAVILELFLVSPLITYIANLPLSFCLSLVSVTLLSLTLELLLKGNKEFYPPSYLAPIRLAFVLAWWAFIPQKLGLFVDISITDFEFSLLPGIALVMLILFIFYMLFYYVWCFIRGIPLLQRRL